MPQCVQETSTQGFQHLDTRFTESVKVKALPFSLYDFCIWEILFYKISILLVRTFEQTFFEAKNGMAKKLDRDGEVRAVLENK